MEKVWLGFGVSSDHFTPARKHRQKKKKNNKTKKQHQEVLIFKKGMRNTCLSTFTSSKLDFVFLQMTIIAS